MKKKIRNLFKCSTVCSESKEKYRNPNNTEDFKELEKIYDLWLENHNNMKKKEKNFMK